MIRNIVWVMGLFALNAGAAPPEDAPRAPRLLSHSVERFEYSGSDVPGFHQVKALRLGVLLSGLSVFGASYASVAWIGVIVPGAAILAVPVAGPLIAGGASLGSGSFNLTGVFIFADGLAQLAGLAMFLYSLAMPAVWLERDAVLPVSLALTPGGVAVRGHF